MVRFKYASYDKVYDIEHNGVDEVIYIIGFAQWNQYLCAIKRHILHLYSIKESNWKKEDLVSEQ